MALMAQYGDDPELLAAIKASMNEAQMNEMVIPDEPGTDVDPALICLIRFRAPDGK